MRKNEIRYALLITIGAVCIIIFSQILSSVLSSSSFENTYRATLISRYRIISKEIRKNLETAIDYGKPLDKFSGYKRIVEISAGEDLKAVKEILVASPDGFLFYANSGSETGAKVPFPKIPVFKSTDEEYVFTYNNDVYLSFPLFYNQTEWTGVLYLAIDSGLIKDNVKRITDKTYFFFIILLALALALVLAVFIPLFLFVKKSKQREITVSVVLFLILFVSQGLFGFVNNRYYESEYFKIFNENMKTLSRVVKTGFDYVLSLDIKIERMKKAEELLRERVKDNAECLEMVITDTDGNMLYKADKDGALSVLEPDQAVKLVGNTVSFAPNPYRIITPLNAGMRMGGFLFVYMNQEIIKAKERDLILDILTVVVVSIVFGFELMGFLGIIIQALGADTKKGVPRITDEGNLHIIRFTSFVFFFAELLPLSFMPLFISEVFNLRPLHLFAFSQGTMMSLPIASYMLGVMIFVPLVGFITEKLGVKKILVGCTVLLFSGALFSAFSTSLMQLMIARFISGAGYGGIIISSTALVISMVSANLRTTGFGYWSAGFASAAICAVPVGGVLVSRLGFRYGMLVSGGFSIFLFLFVLLFIKKDAGESAPNEEKKKMSLSDFLCIFQSRNLLVNTLLSSIPYSLAYIGLFQYLFPLFMNNTGISQANIARILTLYGVISLMTPLVSRLADRYRNDKLFIVIGNALTGIFLLFFLINSSFIIFIVVMIGIGLGSMMTDAVTESFITSTTTAKRIGEAKTLGIITTYEKMIAIFVPIVAGALTGSFGYVKSVVVIGVFIMGSTALFALLSTNPRKRECKSDDE